MCMTIRGICTSMKRAVFMIVQGSSASLQPLSRSRPTRSFSCRAAWAPLPKTGSMAPQLPACRRLALSLTMFGVVQGSSMSVESTVFMVVQTSCTSSTPTAVTTVQGSCASGKPAVFMAIRDICMSLEPSMSIIVQGSSASLQLLSRSRPTTSTSCCATGTPHPMAESADPQLPQRRPTRPAYWRKSHQPACWTAADLLSSFMIVQTSIAAAMAARGAEHRRNAIAGWRRPRRGPGEASR
mmetsp:Transcript_35029/g.109022  ORF Transcript_35029/g.109022 Transcript_35029/m.109022 type:complete len:240 (+) Transcript_35029:583-1302(+)